MPNHAVGQYPEKRARRRLFHVFVQEARPVSGSPGLRAVALRAVLFEEFSSRLGFAGIPLKRIASPTRGVRDVLQRNV